MKHLPLTLFSFLLFVVARLAAAPEPLRLDALAAARFTQTAPGQWSVTQGLLTSVGQFKPTSTLPVLSSVTVPAEALNRTLITLEAWLAYERLGDEAVCNYVADFAGPTYRVGERTYMDVAAHPVPKISHGKLANFSSRSFVAPGKPLIGGIVIDGQHRWVLVRAIGPALAGLGVDAPLPDPFLTIYRGSTPWEFNNDWSTQLDATAVAAAAAKVGAFPLAGGTKDSALLVELPPGVYTAHASSATEGAGEVLLEIYSVPE